MAYPWYSLILIIKNLQRDRKREIKLNSFSITLRFCSPFYPFINSHVNQRDNYQQLVLNCIHPIDFCLKSSILFVRVSMLNDFYPFPSWGECKLWRLFNEFHGGNNMKPQLSRIWFDCCKLLTWKRLYWKKQLAPLIRGFVIHLNSPTTTYTYD